VVQEVVVLPPILAQDLQEVHLAVHPEVVEDLQEVVEEEEVNILTYAKY